MVRQHVNPLSGFFQQPRPLPPPDQLFADPTLPIHLDIGCARGRCLLAMAQLNPRCNHLGVEIRQALVRAAERERASLGIPNLHILFCNANVSLEAWLAALRPGQLQQVSIQFPDPWFKRRHHKRRVLQPALLLAIAGALAEGGAFFLQSDVLAVITPMLALSEASGCFERPAADPRPWRSTNPLPVPSERERQVLQQGLPVYRVLYRRTAAPLPQLAALEQWWKHWLEGADNPANDAAAIALPTG